MARKAPVGAAAVQEQRNSSSSDAEVDVPTELIISPDIPSLPTSTSRARRETSPSMVVTWSEQQASESDPLLGGGANGKRGKKPFYRARPLWIVPFAIIASITRGMTIAPRVEVFTQLSCSALHGHPIDYNHTRSHHDDPQVLSIFTPDYKTSSIHDTFTTLTLSDDNGDNDGWGDPEDPTHLPTKRCLQDPAVQAGAARLQMIMTTTMGALSALTTGWWGHFGERHGRTCVLSASTLGWLLTDLIFILVSLPHSPLAAHGHKLLIVSPIIEGSLGGWSTLQGATSAYISDCTSDGSRAHIFSRFTGVFFLGFAVGPMVGAFILTHPSVVPFFSTAVRSVTPVFCAAVFLSFTNFLLALTVLPESLKLEQRTAHREAEEHAKAVALAEAQAQGKKPKGGALKGLFVPLLVFAPKKRSYGQDWNMTLLVIALFGYLLSSGIYQLKYLYAEHVFEWEAEQLSYYVTFMGGARAVCLLFVMPLIISAFKPKPKPTTQQPNAVKSTNGKKKPRPTPAQLAHEMKFDIRLARGSYMIDILSHTLMALSSTAATSAAQAAFVGFTSLSSFGAGVIPAVQSLALCIIQADAAEDEEAQNNLAQQQQQQGASSQGVASEQARATRVKPPGKGTGTLFGAFAVLQATGQMILGPMLFGLVYSSTVAKFPKAIFVLAASILIISLSLLMFVHPHQVKVVEQQKKLRQRQKKKGRDYWGDGEIERGRSRVSKDLSGSGSGSSWPSMPSGSGSSAYSGRYSSTIVESQPIRSQHGSEGN